MHKEGLTIGWIWKVAEDTLSKSKGFELGPKEKGLGGGMLVLKRRLVLLQGIYVMMIFLLHIYARMMREKKKHNVAILDTKKVK